MKKVTFKIIMAFMPIFFFLVLEIILRFFFPVNYPKLFIDDPNDSRFLVQNKSVASRYFTSIDEIPFAAHDPFLKEKTSNVFRVFVIGESTAAGFPYSHGVSFPRQLQYLLQVSYPDKYIEVVNTSMSAISSHVFADFIPEIIDQSPDLIIFHGGHNEYYGALTVGSSERLFNSVLVTKVYLAIRKFSTVDLIRKALSSMRYNSKKPSKLNRTLMEEMVRDEEITLGSKSYFTGLNTFEINFKNIIQKFKNQGVNLICSSVVWNEKDVFPLEYSSKLLAPSDVVDLSDLLDLNSMGSESINYFSKGMEYFQNSEYKKAKDYFILAKESDKIRFRAPNAIQNSIRLISNEQGLPFVDLYELFEKKSNFGILDSSLLTEHVHPNSKGYELMAFGFFEKIVSLKLIDNTSVDVDSIQREFNMRRTYSQLELRMGEIVLAQLIHSWPFVSSQYQDAIYSIESFPVKSKIDQLAKSVLTKKMEWPDAVYQYVDMIEDLDPNEAISGLAGLSQEYPYISEIGLRSNEIVFKIHADTSEYHKNSLILIKKLSTVADKLSLINQLFRHRMFETLQVLINDVSFNVPNKNLYQKAIKDIIIAEDKSNASAEKFINAAGAAIYIKNSDLASSYLYKADSLGADSNKIAEFKRLIK